MKTPPQEPLRHPPIENSASRSLRQGRRQWLGMPITPKKSPPRWPVFLAYLSGALAVAGKGLDVAHHAGLYAGIDHGVLRYVNLAFVITSVAAFATWLVLKLTRRP